MIQKTGHLNKSAHQSSGLLVALISENHHFHIPVGELFDLLDPELDAVEGSFLLCDVVYD